MTDLGTHFRELHHGSRPLIVPNPWDLGSAVIFERLGFEALATTSAGMAFGLGKSDGQVSPEETLEHCSSLAAATTVPISGDLERGFGDSPEEVADAVRRAALTGLAGCSIEDYTGRSDEPMYPRNLAVERIAAAIEAARGLDHDFVVTARCDSLLWTEQSLDEVISLLRAYESVGADVLFAPGLESLRDIGAVCEAVEAPVSVGLEMSIKPSIDELSEVGVSRVSVGSLLAQVAYGAAIEPARELLEAGTLHSAASAIDYYALEGLFTP